MREILALARKDLCLLIRDKVGFIFALVFPLVYSIFFGVIFSGMSSNASSKLPIVVVDEDQTEGSRAYIESLAADSALSITTMDRDAAADAVRRGKRLAYVALPKRFGEHSNGMFWGHPPTLEVGIDPSRQAEAAMLQGMLIKNSFQGLQEMFQKPEAFGKRVDGWMNGLESSKETDPVLQGALRMFLPALKNFVLTAPQTATADDQGNSDDAQGSSGPFDSGWQPIVIEQQSIARENTNAFAVSFPQGITWGVMGCAAAFAISLVLERTNGTLIRLRMAPIARWQILAGKALACFLTTVAMVTVLLLLATIVYKVRAHSVPMLVLSVVCVSLAFVGIMMLLSVVGKTEQAAAGIGWGVLILMSMIGGGMVPRSVMPSWLQSLSYVSPVRWAIEAMEGSLWRQYSLAEMFVPCVILLAVGALSFFAGVRTFKWTN